MRVVRGGDAGAEPEDDERGDGGGDARAGVRVFGVANAVPGRVDGGVGARVRGLL